MSLPSTGIVDLGSSRSFVVASSSDPDLCYIVTVLDKPFGNLVELSSTCTCAAGQQFKKCRHVKAVTDQLEEGEAVSQM